MSRAYGTTKAAAQPPGLQVGGQWGMTKDQSHPGIRLRLACNLAWFPLHLIPSLSNIPFSVSDTLTDMSQGCFCRAQPETGANPAIMNTEVQR